eukprot:TRINITY_DN8577_c1_g2_i1.p1 TRINITY_DN8577_c1_g2~~TRINITY_DN8577_c1_g2_i1.p1  ORF type:complete len:535 (+),score=122.25 TRINITY_DN8577_c1_g2_i1:80-1606(+)
MADRRATQDGAKPAKKAKKQKRIRLEFVSDPDEPLKYRPLQQLIPALLNLTDVVPSSKIINIRNRTATGQVQIIHLPEISPSLWKEHYEAELKAAYPSYSTRLIKASGASRRIEPALQTLFTLNRDNDLKPVAKPQPSSSTLSFEERWYKLCLTPEQQQEHDYEPSSDRVWLGGNKVMPTAAEGASAKPVQPSSPRVFAVDCEMVETRGGLELARVTVVGWDEKVVYDSLVQPSEPVIDYKTQYSGITAAMLTGVTTTLTDVRARLQQLIARDDILVGHSLENDLRALRVRHEHVVDTAVLLAREGRYKQKLSHLARNHLQREIQQNVQGHDSAEDASAALQLAKMAADPEGNMLAELQKQRDMQFNILKATLRMHPQHGVAVVAPSSTCQRLSSLGLACVPIVTSHDAVRQAGSAMVAKAKLRIVELPAATSSDDHDNHDQHQAQAVCVKGLLDCMPSNCVSIIVASGHRAPFFRGLKAFKAGIMTADEVAVLATRGKQGVVAVVSH